MDHRLLPVAHRVVPLLALALLAAGCGKSKERELYEEREAACASVLGLTISSARTALLNREDAISCSAAGQADSLNRLPAEDTCGGADTGLYLEDVCQIYFFYIANDPALCDGSFGCTYGCEARVNAADIAVVGNTLDASDAVICARTWIP